MRKPLASSLIALLLVICAVTALANPQPQKQPTPKPTSKPDTYGKAEKYCYNKCFKYSSIKGKCTDYKWQGTTKKCVDYKVIGKGKCIQHKRETHCLKWEGPSTICIAHGTKPVCAKKEKLVVCEKEDFKKSCTHKGSNGICSEWAFRDLCLDSYTPPKKPDPYAKCDLYSYIPKLDCKSQKRCVHYKTDNYCSKQTLKCEKSCKWEEVKKQDLYVPHNAQPKPVQKGKKPTPDPYAPPKVFRKVCHKKCHNICSVYSKRVTCEKYEDVKFCKKTGYTQFCAQQAPAVDGYVPPPDHYVPQCRKQKRVKYCIKWKKEEHCDNFKKVRVCLKKKTTFFCAAYKSVSFCTQHENLPKRCVKNKHTKKCVQKSEGEKVCAKYAFEGGKPICQHFAQKTVCSQKKRICTNVKEDNHDVVKDDGKKSHKKGHKKHHKKGPKKGKKPSKKNHGKKVHKKSPPKPQPPHP